MTKLRITPDGRIRGLWTDDVQLGELGFVRVQRASHVEFDNRLQCWTVRSATSTASVSTIIGWLNLLIGKPPKQIIHQAHSRSQALAWEHEHFQPGGPYWPNLTRRLGNDSHPSPSSF